MDLKPMSRKLIVNDPNDAVLTADLGGKADNLYQLKQFDFPVPDFFTVRSIAFLRHCQTIPETQPQILRISQLAQNPNQPPEDLDQAIKDLQSQIINASIESELQSDLESEIQQSHEEGTFYAVRSSAADEDGADHSFAGMHDTFLFVKPNQIIDRLKRVWASAFQPRAIAYRARNNLAIDQIAVAVIVQKMVNPRASGVAFTINPANDRTDQTVISSVWGVGEGLVSGALAADTFTVDKRSLTFDSDIVKKTEAFVFDSRGGLQEQGVPLSKQSQPSLNEKDVKAVAQVAHDIELRYGRPQDIEFCIDSNGKLLVLQTRPVTNIKQYGPAAGNRIVWDNSNIIESYSGVTSPMTFSFIRRAYTIVYHCFAQVMGISKTKVRAHRHVFENMLGLIRGRVYYNLQNWYRLIRLFPGFQYNASFMESMMGLKEPLVLDETPQPPGLFRRWFVELPALLRLILRTMWNFIRIKSIVGRFQDSFHRHYQTWDQMDFSELAPHEIKKLYDEMEEALLWNWKAPIINDFYVMIYYGLLKRICEKWIGDPTGALQNDLICGEGGLESAEPARMLLRMAADAKSNPELTKVIFSEPLEAVPEKVRSRTEFHAFSGKMNEYLKQFGFRCMNELKLEEFSLRDHPHRVYQVLRNYLSLKDESALDVDAMQAREQRIRADAEATAFKQPWQRSSIWPRKWILKRVLRNARLGVKNRENMRFARTRIYGLLRELIRAMGARFANEGILSDAEDVFSLTLDEIWDYLKGTAVTTRLSELAQIRKAEFDEYRDTPAPDDRFETFGFACHKNLFQNPNDGPIEIEDGQLKGTGCCPGSVTKTVRVLAHPTDNLGLSGEILVAERTDPGWVPLYPAVSGILIERGSVLSHSAVVAREMGIPTIVGIKGLLQYVQDGITVTMDGEAGTVTVLPDEQE